VTARALPAVFLAAFSLWASAQGEPDPAESVRLEPSQHEPVVVGAPAAQGMQGPPLLLLVLAPGDQVDLLRAALDYWRRTGRCLMPRIIALEPGPLVLESGLRLLPNEVVPHLNRTDEGLPRLLLISGLGRLRITLPFLAYLRLCLAQGVAVWVVGDRLPDGLTDLPLEPGQSIARVALAELDRRHSLLATVMH